MKTSGNPAGSEPRSLREELRNRILVKRRVAHGDVLDPLRRNARVIDHKSRAITDRSQRKPHRGVDPGRPGRRMRSAKTPRLYDSLPRHKLDLPALHATTEDREGIAFSIGDLGRLPR